MEAMPAHPETPSLPVATRPSLCSQTALILHASSYG